MKTQRNSLVCVEATLPQTKDEKYIFVTEFDDSAFEKFYKLFSALEADPDVRIIPIMVHSFGGDVHALLAMLDLIDGASKPVATIGIGKAMSCGAFLLAAGTKGYRYAAPNADIMLHEVSSGGWGKNTELQNNTKSTKRLNDLVFKDLAERSTVKDKKFFTKKLRALGNVDWYLSAMEYKKLGLIDHIGVPTLVTQ